MHTPASLMRAAIVEEAGGPFRVVEVERPAATAGKVIVRVRASGVNPLDAKIRAGVAPHARHPLPAILGMDVAGTVEEVGEGVTQFVRGDEVFGMVGGVGGIPGTLAQFAAADPLLLAHKPANLTMREAAALPLAFITAWEGLVDRMNLDRGKTLLVHGGAGGVGHVVVQLGQALGARVYATGRASQLEAIQSLGAIGIDYENIEVGDYVSRYTEGRGFDYIYDTAGDESLTASFQAIAQYGHVVSALGRGPQVLGPLSLKGASYSGVFTLFPLLSGEGREHHRAILRAAADLVATGKLMPRVDPREFNLEQIVEAHQALQDHARAGKIVVCVA